MSDPQNISSLDTGVATPPPVQASSPKGALNGREVSALSKVKNWFSDNRKIIALVLLVVGLVAATVGLGLVVGALAGGSALIGAKVFTVVAFGKITVTGSTFLTTTGQVLVGGAIAAGTGAVAAAAGGGYLLGRRHR